MKISTSAATRPPGTKHMNALKKITAFAEEQIVYGRNLSDAMAARDGLRRGRSGSESTTSLRQVNARIGRMLSAEAAPKSPVRSRAGSHL